MIRSTKIIYTLSVLLMFVAGCSSDLKYLAINQLVGLATAVTSAAATSLVGSLVPAG
jgi:Kef-type K+ transport system membrane component KefB